ncbi:L-histidine N(alpha)-methyltransferase [Orrella sp. JC864]|uniref:L-histidine N(alpha)-methyltransferase n=1 Tax=Orrella sp. JC864 TaxID=3120298 RepID=UPI00300BB180
MTPVQALARGPAAAASDFETDLVQALSSSPRSIAPKYFYDSRGSALFDRICELPEYYPTRTELAILHAQAGVIAELLGSPVDLVEFGAGSLTKVRILLDALARRGAQVRYVPIDIAGEHLQRSAQDLRRQYPGLQVLPVIADYTQPFALPAPLPGCRRVGFFPGSTLGNFPPGQARAFLAQSARLLRGGGLLLGVDLLKDPAMLHAAYNDARGVTAQFNLNLLRRANEELGADFDLQGFAHYALYQPQARRIEMHLVSLRRQSVTVAGRRFAFEPGDTLHTENSYKFTVQGLRELAREAGLQPGPAWTDPQALFSVHWLRAPADAGQART